MDRSSAAQGHECPRCESIEHTGPCFAAPRSSPRYRTIVADPPWRYPTTLPAQHGRADARRNQVDGRDKSQRRSSVPYDTLSIAEIAALPIRRLADDDAHLYLWTTNRHLEDAWYIIKAWGFSYSTLIPWCKAPRGLVGGATFTICTEYVIFARRGSLRSSMRHDRNWWQWTRTQHSVKPEEFFGIVEQTSPGPRLELFARRQRAGWDVWGNEVESDVEMTA